MANPLDAGTPLGSFPDGPPGSGEPGLQESFLIDAANTPQSYMSDNQMYSERTISELIALDRYLKSRTNTAATRPTAGGWAMVGISKAIPPDAMGDG